MILIKSIPIFFRTYKSWYFRISWYLSKVSFTQIVSFSNIKSWKSYRICQYIYFLTKLNLRQVFQIKFSFCKYNSMINAFNIVTSIETLTKLGVRSVFREFIQSNYTISPIESKLIDKYIYNGCDNLGCKIFIWISAERTILLKYLKI